MSYFPNWNNHRKSKPLRSSCIAQTLAYPVHPIVYPKSHPSLIFKSFHDALWSFSLPSAKSPLSLISFSKGSNHILALTQILYFCESGASPKPSQVMAAPTSILKITGPESEMVALFLPFVISQELFLPPCLKIPLLLMNYIGLSPFTPPLCRHPWSFWSLPYSLKILAHPSLLFKRLHMTQWTVIIFGHFCFHTTVSSQILKFQFLPDPLPACDLVFTPPGTYFHRTCHCHTTTTTTTTIIQPILLISLGFCNRMP